jgi:hypothetical protein
VRSPLFCQELIEGVDLQITVGQQPLEPAGFPLQFPQPPGFGDLQTPEFLALPVK